MSIKIKCSHILVAKHGESLAVLERIKKGEKVRQDGKRSSQLIQVAEKRTGNLGYFTKGMMVKPFEETAFKLEIGQISQPVKSEFGYHIIKRMA